MDILVKTSAAAAAASAAAAPAPASTPESVSRIDLHVVRSVALSGAYFDKPLVTQDESLAQTKLQGRLRAGLWRLKVAIKAQRRLVAQTEATRELC